MFRHVGFQEEKKCISTLFKGKSASAAQPFLRHQRIKFLHLSLRCSSSNTGFTALGLSWQEQSYCSANSKAASRPLTSVCSLIDRTHTDNVPNYFFCSALQQYFYPLKFIPFLISAASDLHCFKPFCLCYKKVIQNKSTFVRSDSPRSCAEIVQQLIKLIKKSGLGGILYDLKLS